METNQLKKGRGRPRQSKIRQNIVDMLFHMKKAYGYEIFKHYVQLFPKCSLRSIHHHLKFGVKTGEFASEAKKEKGQFSWGEDVEKVYYVLGPAANPRKNERVEQYFLALKK